MEFQWDETLLGDALRACAEARGQLARFADLVALREDDGLAPADAERDAGEALGLVAELESGLEAALSHLEDLLERPFPRATVADGRAGMPTLRVEDEALRLELPPCDSGALAELAARLVARLAEDAERTAVTVAEGLGGTGGCAAGECLPEDAPAGPLFDRR